MTYLKTHPTYCPEDIAKISITVTTFPIVDDASMYRGSKENILDLEIKPHSINYLNFFSISPFWGWLSGPICASLTA